MQRKTFSYSWDYDNLIISNRQENEKVRENFMLGDIVFSMTGTGKIVSIDIRSASYFLESCGITPEMLRDATNIEFEVAVKRDSLFIVLKIEGFENENLLKASVPMIVPMTNW